jgi:hypothetical protein
MFELQSRWVAMALSNKIDLPSPQEMMNSVEFFYAELQASGKAKGWAHCLTSTQVNMIFLVYRNCILFTILTSWVT